MRAIEFFAGIGGLRLGMPPAVEVVAAYDQHEPAVSTYARNHGARPIRLDLATVREQELARHRADTWLLSPPCQPFSRRGARRDVDDPRAAGLLRLIELLPRLAPRRLLLENVIGFVGSQACARLQDALGALGHEIRVIELCPSQLGAPVRRPRQYLLASGEGFGAATPAPAPAAGGSFEALLDGNPAAGLRIPIALEPRFEGAVARAGEPLATFTRSYGRAIRGAGPVLRDGSGLRWFSPEEILRLHGFPASHDFPPELALRTRWRLAGNGVHVAAVAAVARALA